MDSKLTEELRGIILQQKALEERAEQIKAELKKTLPEQTTSDNYIKAVYVADSHKLVLDTKAFCEHAPKSYIKWMKKYNKWDGKDSYYRFFAVTKEVK